MHLNSLTNDYSIISIIASGRLLKNTKGRKRKSLTGVAKEEISKFTLKMVKFNQSDHE